MRVFISEYVCSGACGELDAESSLACEGRAMLLALLADAARVPGWTVCTTWDRRLGEFPFSSVDVIVVGTPSDESTAFERLAKVCDATYVIAPELDDLLTMRCLAVQRVGGRSLNSSVPALRLSSDKWQLAQRLAESRVSTIPTRLCVGDPAAACEFPAVLKPRFGAGSQDIYLVRNPEELEEHQTLFDTVEPTRQAIIQPLVQGRSASLAALFDEDGRLSGIWPLAWQHLTDDGRFRYTGGRVPVEWQHGAAIAALVGRAGAAVDGLRGYVGFDITIPDSSPAEPVLVEINARLTTSYIGYRALSEENLARRFLQPGGITGPVAWRPIGVRYFADGRVVVGSDRKTRAKYLAPPFVN